MKKLLKSKKGLSPVVAAIILIAVTVAVSIAVAAWMGALTFTFMGTEELTINSVTWGSGQVTLVVENTGTKSLTVEDAKVNHGAISCTDDLGAGKSMDTGATLSVVITFNYNNGTKYDLTVVTASNNEFTAIAFGGQNIA